MATYKALAITKIWLDLPVMWFVAILTAKLIWPCWMTINLITCFTKRQFQTHVYTIRKLSCRLMSIHSTTYSTKPKMIIRWWYMQALLPPMAAYLRHKPSARKTLKILMDLVSTWWIKLLIDTLEKTQRWPLWGWSFLMYMVHANTIKPKLHLWSFN